MKHRKPVALFLTPVAPWPTGSGRALRAWDWLQTLSRDYRVHVITLGAARDHASITEDYPATRVWVAEGAKVFKARFCRAIGLLFPFVVPWFPSLVLDWPDLPPSDRTLCELESLLAGQSVKRIVVFRLYMHNLALKLAQRWPEAIMNLDMDDHESRSRLSVAGALARMGRYRDAAREFASGIQYHFLERYMRGPYRTAYLSAESDCVRFGTRLADKVEQRPNRLVTPQNLSPPPCSNVFTLLFVGILGYPPNEEAVRFLVDRLIPELVRQLTRPWRLCVVGRDSSDELSRLMQRDAHVQHVGDARTLEMWYADAHAVLIPLRAGGGTKYKALEGFAHRRPVVSTAHGMRGLGAVADTHFLLAQTARSFASAVDRLAQDPVLADRIAEAGWRLYQENFRLE